MLRLSLFGFYAGQPELLLPLVQGDCRLLSGMLNCNETESTIIIKIEIWYIKASLILNLTRVFIGMS